MNDFKAYLASSSSESESSADEWEEIVEENKQGKGGK